MNTSVIYYRTVQSVITLTSSNHMTIRIRTERHWSSFEPQNKKLRLIVEVEGKVFENGRTDYIKWEIGWSPTDLSNLDASVDRILSAETQGENVAECESEIYSHVHPAVTMGLINSPGSHLGYIDFRRENRIVRATFSDAKALTDFKEHLLSSAHTKGEEDKAA